MNSILRIRLETSAEQHTRLLALQQVFAEVCNALAVIAQRTGCWNRVALHHLVYRSMRLQYPALGSQMICNAIYSVSRACRHVYQHPQSVFNLQRLAGKPLPLLRFLPTSPVYFDRHTLSLKDGQASMYTLDGRMRFNLPLAPEDERRFRQNKLREVVLQTSQDGLVLNFCFAELGDDPLEPAVPTSNELPEYLLIVEDAAQTRAPGGLPADPTPAAAAQASASAAH